MRKFWIIAAAILVWNLIGDAAYLMQVTADHDAMAKTDPVTAEAFRSMPPWAWSAYAVAVWGGTAAAVALILRRGAAAWLFLLSLTGVVVQFGWTFLVYGLIAKKDASTVIFPLVIAAITMASLLYARAKSSDGTLR